MLVYVCVIVICRGVLCHVLCWGVSWCAVCVP